MVGDHWMDIQAGRRAGVAFTLGVLGRHAPDWFAPCPPDAAGARPGRSRRAAFAECSPSASSTGTPATICGTAWLAVRPSARDETMEVIVVDNASEDGSGADGRAEFPQAVLIANADNRGYAEGNNQALTRAGGDVLLLLNPDVVVHPDALTRALAFLRARPDCGALGCRLVGDGRRDPALRARLPGPPARPVGILRPGAPVPAQPRLRRVPDDLLRLRPGGGGGSADGDVSDDPPPGARPGRPDGPAVPDLLQRGGLVLAGQARTRLDRSGTRPMPPSPTTAAAAPGRSSRP